MGTNLSLVATQLPGLQPEGVLENTHPTSPGIVAEKLCEVLNPQFEFVKLVPLSATSEVRDRWLRPFVAATGPAHRVLSLSSKELLEFELSCSSRHLRQDKTLPLFMHPQQVASQTAIAHCTWIVRMWTNVKVGSEEIIISTTRQAMERLAQEVCLPYSTSE